MKKQPKRLRPSALLPTLFPVCLLLLSGWLASCNTAPESSKQSLGSSAGNGHATDNQEVIPDSLVAFLLDASAKDFHANQPPTPVDFRDVTTKNLKGSDAANHFMLCGQFLAKDKQTAGEWTAFATIQTSGYEQWIGNQALGYCQEAKAVSYRGTDLAQALKDRLNALQRKPK